jgi:outer membrane receptor protein involved in Fe transport
MEFALRIFRSSLSLFALSAVLVPFALSQTSKGTLAGVVRDTSGAVIPNATVTVTSEDTGEHRSVQTANTGAFRVDAISPGRYTIHVASTGFSQFDIKNLPVKPTQVTDYDPVMTPGQVDQTVEVNGAQVLLDTENASLGNDIGSTQIAKLPIFSLNPIELALNVPGVQIVSNSGFSNGEAIQVSGARPRANNFLIDGQEINDASIAGQAVQPEIPGMYSNVIVYTHNPPAEFGRASGGVVNLITRSGTNTFHGDVWELYSGSGLNARDGQLRQSTTGISRYDQHQYGFTIGGPIIKSKLFAFGAAQWTRYYGLEEASVDNLPDANGYALLQQLANGGNKNAQTLLPYLDNGSYLNTFSNLGAYTTAALGAACPATQPGCTVSVGRFLRPSEAEKSPDTQWTYKVDFIPHQADTFSFRYLHDRASLTPDFFNNGQALPGFDTNQGGPSELGQGTWTHVFSPTLLNELRGSEARLSFLFGVAPTAAQNPIFASPSLSFSTKTGFPGLGFNQNFPQGRSQDLYQIQDTLSWTVGRNTIRVGADIGRRIEKDLVSQNLNGTFSFTDGGTGTSSLGNFLLNQLGPSGTATLTFGSTRLDPHSWRSGVFGQDDVKVTSDLTLNLGVRYDYFTNPENVLKYPALDPNNPYAPVNTVYKVAADVNNIAPRVGFAYSPHSGIFSGGKTVFRGGFGVFFDSDFTNIADNSQQSSPNSVAITQTQTTGNGLSNALQQLAGAQPILNPLATVESVTKNLVSPYTYEFNLGFERALPGAVQLTVNYVGSEGKSLYANQQYNYFSADTGLRLNPDRGAIIARGNFAASDYNGLEVGVQRRFSHGLEINASYDYSKSLDDGSEVFTTDSSPTSYSANLAPGGRSQDWGPSAYDHRHYATVTYVYSPPGAHSTNKFMNELLDIGTRGWTFSGEEQFQSGAYSTVNFSGLDANGDGSSANDRPLLSNKNAPFNTVGIDGAYLGATPGVYYDLAANNASGAVNVVNPGNVHWLIYNGPQFLKQSIGRNSFENPGLQVHNLAVEKAISTPFFHGEKGSLILRGEAQNIGNHDNVGLLDVNLLDVGTSSFQNLSNARNTDARNLRLWAKFQF